MMDREPDEYELALRARDGDREALAELVARTRLRLFALAYAELRHYDDAQDAVAAALLQICRHVHELREPESIRAWMQSIVRNEVRRLRRGPEARELSLEAAEDHAETDGPSLLRVDIDRALCHLPWEEARAIRLFYLDDLSIHAIARQTGRPEGTVKSWLHRGRRRLASEMKEYAPMTRKGSARRAAEPSRAAALIHTDLDPTLLQRITDALRTGGYRIEVMTAGDPVALLEPLKAYQLLVLDEWLGGRSAFELLMHLKTVPQTRVLPVCLLCEAPSVFTATAYHSAGVDRLVQKDVPDDLARLAEPFEKRGGMWQTFTERARRIVFFAQEEAARLGENLVDTPHLLLGLLREPDCLAGRILSDRLGISLEALRAELEPRLTRGEGALGQDMQLTPRCKRVIDLAHEESQRLGHNYIGTEHLLLGLAAEGEGVAARVLAKLGADTESIRRAVQAPPAGG